MRVETFVVLYENMPIICNNIIHAYWHTLTGKKEKRVVQNSGGSYDSGGDEAL